MRYVCLLVLIALSSTSSAQSGQLCFATAETYYEQVYCKLQARAQTKNLPLFREFRNNTENVQYSLLKRLAERNSIKLPAPAKKTASNAQQKISLKPIVSSAQINREKEIGQRLGNPVSEKTLPTYVQSFNNCQLLGKSLHCGEKIYALVANKANHRLAKNVLSSDNKMELPDYQQGDFDQYLGAAYHRYIVKMCDIGLGSVTMTYKKFAYLYQDLQVKGLNFRQRFEIMYSFLKKDKASLGVSEAAILPTGFQPKICTPLSDFYVCDHAGRNYIFELQ